MRGLWLTSHVRAEPEGAAAVRAAEALGEETHARLLDAGDRLAGVSPSLAQRYYLQAAAAWRAFGPAGFARWLALGEALATQDPGSRDAAAAFFAAPPAAFAGGVEGAAAWAALARRVAGVSRRAAAAFLEHSRALLELSDAAARLEAWVAAGLALADGARGATLAQAWFEAPPGLPRTLAAAEYAALADVVRALAATAGERAVLAGAPPGLEAFVAAERRTLLRAVVTLAGGSPAAAHAVWRTLPAALADAAPGVRAAVVRLAASVGPRAAAALADVAPVTGALVRAVPVAEREPVLALVEEVAARAPAAAVAALRVLPRLYETARPDVVRAWFATGLRVAEAQPDTAEPYFALESRTSVRALEASSAAATLDDARGVWTKLVQMLSGTPATARPFEGRTLRPPLEAEPARDEVALPLRIDWFPTHEENARLYRLLAAQVAGRRAFGTYLESQLLDRLRGPDRPPLLESFFLLAEAVRVQHRLGMLYPGLAADGRALGARVLERLAEEPAATQEEMIDALLAHHLAGGAAGRRPRWLAPGAAAAVDWLVRPLEASHATVEDSIAVAEALVGAALTEGAVVDAEASAHGALLPELAGEMLLEGEPGDGDGAGEAPGPDGAPASGPMPGEDDALRIELAPLGDAPEGGRPLSPEELRRLIEAGARVKQGSGDVEGPGLSAADLLGKLPAAARAALRDALAAAEADDAGRLVAVGDGDRRGPCFWYDEWDHRLGDYRSRWCRLFEVDLGGDDGQFFARVLGDYGDLVPQVRREFQRIRPEMYRAVRGLEDGEDFDLNAVVEARVELRARRAPSSRLYSARVREARDVATLFLLDMSASTDEPVEAPQGDRPPRRIIDVTRAALVVMAEALEEIGDAYAVYGFSGQGRTGVEVYPVKSFTEPLNDAVKARIGGMVPRRSTRMGAALRHVVAMMSCVGARSKHLILLSDGFPQDLDYGENRRSHVYGLRDTAVALREAIAAHVSPLCITVDRAGHDYLREMCDASRYVVIEDIALLPRELPKIYRRVVRP